MPYKADCQICITTLPRVILLLWSTLGIARGQVLSPPMFNLAENKRITATATCGETTSGRPLREMYCFLAGATAYSPFQSGSFSYDNDFAELRIHSSPTNEKNEPKNVVEVRGLDMNLTFEGTSALEGGQSCEYCDSSIPELSHPAEHMVDGSPRWWQSPPLSRGMEYNQINITVDLEQEFHVAYVSIIMANSPRPGLWVLERSTDYGKTYKPWQYFAENMAQCEEFFGPDSSQPILDDDSVICSTDYSQIVPLENGQIYITLLNNRPSRGNFSHSEKLQEFTEATNVRIRLLRTKTLQGHLMDLNDRSDHTITRRYFYAIKEIEMGGRCVCNGHAETCDVLDPLRPSRLLCRCEHNTCGDQCSVCCPGFEQKKWQPTRDQQVFQCEPCNCFGHSEECTYDEQIDANRQSLDIRGKYEGGGVCQNCRDNTAGINCDKCVHGYYRPYDRSLNATNVCEVCRCDPHYHTGACEEGSGRCECRPNFLGPDCRQCAPGYYDFPDCKPCDCHVNGTAGGVCEPQNGTCPCKSNYAGTFCDTCANGTYQFPDCIECKCEELGAVDKNCAKKTGDCHCKINYGGKSCELCADGYYDHPKCSYCDCDPAGTEKEVCDKKSGVCNCKEGYTGKRCDQCNNTFYGYPDCKACECDLTGSMSAECNKASGFCECKANFTGRRCNKCSAGYYGYPQCSACNCDKFGSYGVTCNDNGQCFCKSNFDGTKCEKCKANFFNYPICEECNCDQRGVSTAFLGCDKVPIGELCICKPLVAGRICNQCKATYWNLQARNPNGCEECGCSPSGTLSGLVGCDDVSGQCQCKAHVSGRNCTICRPGYYNLDPSNPFGCQPCNCDIGGSYSSICDGRTGQCRCKPRVNNRNCSEPVEMHYFPSLTHMQYEAEDGRTPDNRAVRFAIDESLFANYSWRGYAVFSPIQDEILLTVDIIKPSLYRLMFRYVNPTMNDVPVNIEFNPTQTYSHDDVEQSTETKLPVSNEPKSAYASKNGSPYPFVLNPGRWTLHIKTKQRLLLDYVAIFPSAYFEGSVLRQDVRNPCLLGEDQPPTATSSSVAEGAAKSCRQYVYPSLPYPKTTAGGLYYEEDGVKKAVPTSTDEKILAKHGQTALLDKQTPYYGEVNVMKPGNYVVVIDYSNLFETIFPVDVEINSIHKGSVNFHHCPFSEFCREVVTKDGKPVNFTSYGNPTKFQLNPTNNISVAVGGIVAIPQLDWTVDYLLPKFRCISQNGKCSASDFLNPPNSLHFDVEPQTETFTQLSQEALPFDVANNLVNLIPLNQNQTVVEIRGTVPSHDHYVLIVHYYNPYFANVHLDVLVRLDHLIDSNSSNDVSNRVQKVERDLPNQKSERNAQISLPFCPSVSGCRAVVKREPDGAQTFEIRKNFALKFFLRDLGQNVYLDYVMPVSWHNYADDVLEPISGQRSHEFLTKCSHLLLSTNLSHYDEYCRKRIFSLTSDNNMGAYPCDCKLEGSTSLLCDTFGGQCSCKPDVIGRQCSMCAPGFYGFPNCQPCNCLRSQQCDPHNGQCFCPLHVEGQQCDKCKPYAFGYDSLIGCQECECNTDGTIDGTLECDQLLGKCKCKENIGGRKCDQCLPGFYGFPHCLRCTCELSGSEPEICDQQTAQCSCKENARGHSCEGCVPGTFFLEERNPKGCTDCFCFGVTSQCHSSDFVKYTIMSMKNWTIDNSSVSIENQHYVEFVSPENSENNGKPNKALYFSAPIAYLGKKLFSYGGKLSFTVSSTPADEKSGRSMAADVLLKGPNETLVYWADELPPDLKEEFYMTVDLIPERWRRNDGGFVTRPVLMQVLNKLEAILIRASQFDRISKARLSRVTLDSASEEKNRVGEEALNVEVCSCPAGYTGTSCEECSDGYYRVQSQTGAMFLGSCVPCKCNGHGDKCDKVTGVCHDCRHDTSGEHCETCIEGFYGNATIGQPDDCRVCPCPHPTAQNNFASSCIVNEIGELHSCSCKQGYTGRNCDRCDHGFFGDPTQPGDFCRPCFCNENNNLTVPGACDPLTGVCSLCQSNTMGNVCEICESWFYGDAVKAKNCQKCSCEKCGSHHCEHSSGVCQCKPNVEGQNCERCVAKAYGYSSCQGCRMCECATASANPQCDSETGKCLCQPGATGRRCEQCEQGYWNYQESGCIKCDCEADLSLGTVCDVRTGQCHCMDGATGPRCDQCIEGYLRVPDYGCRYCDQCVHVLVDDVDRMDVRMTSLEKDLGNVSFIYLTNKRLSRLNDTLSDMELSADPLLKRPTSDVAQKAKDAVDHLKSIADEISIKVNRTEALASKNDELGGKLEEQALMIRRDSHVINVKIRDLVAKLLDMAINFGQGALTTQRREWYIREANETVDSLRNMNFDEHYNDAVKKFEDGQDPLNSIEGLAANQSAVRDKYNKVFKSMEYAHDKFIDLQDSISKATDMLSRSTVLTELTKKHPFFVARGIKTDDELSKCDEFTKNATMWFGKAEQLVISAGNMFNDTVELTNKTKGALANVTTNTENPPDFEELRRNVLQKVQELVKDAEEKVGKFADAKADSSKAQEAASAYKSMYSAIKESETAAVDALAASSDSRDKTQGLSVGSQEAKVNSMAILRGITKTKGAVVNDLKGNLTQIKNRLKTSNETLSDTIRKFSGMKSDFDKLDKVDKNAKAASIEEKAKKVKDDVKDMQNRLSAINEALPKMKEKVQREISSVIDAQENLKAAMAQAQKLAEQVAERSILAKMTEDALKTESDVFANVSASIDLLRTKVLKARDLANRLKVGVKFSPGTSLQLQNPDKISRTSAHSQISLYFKTTEPEGLLLFVGNEQGTAAKQRNILTDDYMAVEIEKGKAKLTYDLGSGPTQIYSNKVVSDNHWHKLTIERTGKLGSLFLETESGDLDRAENSSPGSKSILNLSQNHSRIFVGGVPDSARLPRVITNRHFTGHIEDLFFHGQRLGLWNFALNGSDEAAPAKARNELRQDTHDTGIRLNGEGYVEMSKAPWNPRKEATIRLKFKTFSPFGLLFYIGKERDFLSLSLEGGQVVGQYSLGSGIGRNATPDRYDDGQWHSIELSRLGKTGQLVVDANQAKTRVISAHGLLADLDTSDVYYVGGLRFPLPQSFVFKQSFYGCIDNLKLNDQLVNLADYKSAAFVEIGCPEKAVRVVSFDGSGGGMEFSRVYLGQSFEITFKFKTIQRDALIWLVTDDKNDKILVVTLESGRIVLSSIENRATVFRLKLASRDLSDGAWHYITAIGKEKTVQLDFDDIYTESGEATNPISLPNVEPTLYFGKVPNATLSAMNGNVASRIGPFVGCVGDFTINTRLLDFSNATRSAAGVSYVGCPMADPTDGTGSDADNVTTMSENTAETLEQRKITAPPPPDGCVAYIPGKVEDLAGTRFGLNPFSRLEFDQLPDAFDTKAEFSIQFRATASSGVLIYAGNRIQNDYVTLYMKNGYLFFSFDSGTGPFTLQSKRPYLDFQWHTVVAMRDNRYANLTLNGIVEAKGESPGETYAIDTHKPIFVGGLSNDFYPMAKKNLVGVATSFGGCLRDFRLNGRELTDASSSHGTRPCTDTVENGLFFGPAGGHAILQQNFQVGATFSFEMEMKPLVKNAVILSIAAEAASGGDYLTMQLLDGVLKFAVDNGAGQQTVNVSLPQSEAVCDGHWHSVKIYKTKNILTISLDGSNKFHVIKQVKSTDTNTNNPLYLGGIPEEHMNRGLDTRENFRGCIRDVNIGKKPRRKKHLDVSQVNVKGNVERGGCPLH